MQGPIHNIAISSELDFTAGSPQFDFVFAVSPSSTAMHLHLSLKRVLGEAQRGEALSTGGLHACSVVCKAAAASCEKPVRRARLLDGQHLLHLKPYQHVALPYLYLCEQYVCSNKGAS